MTKTEIIGRLGETAVLLPELIAQALASNDRAKVRLTLLQDAAVQASNPAAAGAGAKPRRLGQELRAAGLDAARFGELAAQARRLDEARFTAPGLGALLDGLTADLQAMLAPLTVAGVPGEPALAQRLKALTAGPRLPEDEADDALAFEAVGRMTAAAEGAGDSVHRLVMDLHRAINRLAADTAVEDLDGAKVHHLGEDDRARVTAFMRGLNRTAPLAFGHPGLGTTAARVGERLTIQNDIGETDAHVIVLHVEGLVATVTYTDVHRRRARFFMRLLDDVAWSPLAEHAADGLGEDAVFHLVTGRHEAADAAALDDFLARLGSRIVFLIDWNKARKTLQAFVDRDAAIELLAWAADAEVGHRALLELGGAGLLNETARRAAGGRIPYGVRLDAALGAEETAGFLRRTLKETSEGLRARRSARLIRDEIQADLAQRFETAESAVMAIVVRHLGLSRTLAALLAQALSPAAGPDERGPALAERAKRMEAKADRLTVEAREACARLERDAGVRRLVDEVENAMDVLDECAFLMSLAAATPPDPAPLQPLAACVVEAVGQMVRAAEAAARLPDGRRDDAAAALQAIDATAEAEREADGLERAAISAFHAAPAPDARPLMLGLEIARALETATDHLAHAAMALRERVLEELSA